MHTEIFCNVYSLPGQIDFGCEASRELNGTAICRINSPGFPPEAVPCKVIGWVYHFALLLINSMYVRILSGMGSRSRAVEWHSIAIQSPFDI